MHKIIIEDLDNNMKSEITGEGVDIWEVGELIKYALLGIGFHPKSVKDLFNESEEE